MVIGEKRAGVVPSSSWLRSPAFTMRLVLVVSTLLAIAAIGCSLPERKHVDPLAIKTDVLGCDDVTARGTLINDFQVDATGSLTVRWVDFFGDVYYEQSEGPFDVPAGGRVNWTVDVTEEIEVPGHCTVNLDFRG
ncbi:MAG: hypothetical protein IIB28_06405 [Chloroflexi bacterium]|nr:hypothetical protein [Chloroflexota bacterium]